MTSPPAAADVGSRTRGRLVCVVGLAIATTLAGCGGGGSESGAADGQVTPSSSAMLSAPAGATPGPAAGTKEVFGATFMPCTSLESDAYPATIPRPSALYYSGPWCRTDQADVSYLWIYARPLTEDNPPAHISDDVRVDAETITLDLSAQGFERVCGVMEAGVRVDAGFEKPGQSVRIRVRALGTSAITGTEPFAVVVAVSGSRREPAVADGVPGPAC